MRSTLVEQSLIDEYLAMAHDEVRWGRMWRSFFNKEELLSNWARSQHEREASVICEQYSLPEDAHDRISNALDAAFMTGLFVGERRLELQRGESDWIAEAYEADSKEPER